MFQLVLHFLHNWPGIFNEKPPLAVVRTDGMAGFNWLNPAFFLLTESGYETQAEFARVVA